MAEKPERTFQRLQAAQVLAASALSTGAKPSTRRSALRLLVKSLNKFVDNETIRKDLLLRIHNETWEDNNTSVLNAVSDLFAEQTASC